jgi:lipoyl(octanoyl) transferase
LEKLKNSIFKDLLIPSDVSFELNNKILSVTKWNWDYEDCLSFQKESQKIISKNRDHKIYIFCNHPHCFTLGRGNERGQDELVDFDQTFVKQLKYPVHSIHRGGGITFHYPGQWIFYPIVSINEKYPLDEHMCWLLKTVKEVLKDNFNLGNVMAAKKLMGVWLGRQKLASIGVGLNRFVSEHGIALNLIYDKDMFNEVQKINPCGMNPTTYTSVSLIDKSKSENLIDLFHKKYIASLK